MNIDMSLYVELLQDEVKRLRASKMKPINDRQGASFDPIEVNGDKISPENHRAVGTMMNRTNRTLDYLNKENQ